MNAEVGALRARGRQPDARLIPQLKNSRAANLIISDGARHPGDEPDPRRLPRTSLSKVRDHAAALAPTGRGAVPEAVHFAIYSDRHAVVPEVAVTVPAEHLWWLAGYEDTVLLSDRATHHYTTVAEVDRVNERVHFLDPWPDEFFLLPGRNTLGLAARREGERGISVSKAEFLRAVVGLVVWDTSKLITDYMATFPEQQRNAEIHLRFGFALMTAGDDAVAAEAASLFAAALRLAEPGNHVAAVAARQAYCAATCGLFRALSTRDNDMREAMQGYLRMVFSRYDVGALEHGLGAPDLCRLGMAAGQVGELGMALRVLDIGVGKDANHESILRARAVARIRCGDAAGAAADAERALALNDAALGRLHAERAAIDRRGNWERINKDGQIAGRLEGRKRELATIAKASVELGLLDRARAAAQELVRLEPDDPANLARLGVVEQKAGRLSAAAAALREALARQRDPDARLAYEAQLREVSCGLGGPT